VTFTKILEKVVKGDRTFDDVAGLYMPEGRYGGLASASHFGHVYTGPAEVPTTFEYSPYVEQRAYYDTLRTQYGAGFFCATQETNRGCPYSCSFCDWGSSTMSKLRRFGMERVAPEINGFGCVGVC